MLDLFLFICYNYNVIKKGKVLKMIELRDFVNELFTEKDSFGDYDILEENKKEILNIIDKFEKELSKLVNTNFIKED